MWFIFLGLCLVSLLAPMPGQAVDRYISPSGNDGNDGATPGSPWQTFGKAQGLGPGYTLYVMNGDYNVYTHGMNAFTGPRGMLAIDCNSNGNTGSSGAPVTIKALEERQAKLLGDGWNVMHTEYCSYWTIEGLYVRNIDVNTGGSGYDGTLIVMNWGTGDIIRRNLLVNANAYFNAHGINANGANILIEENEIYAINRHSIALGSGSTSTVFDGAIVRRNYINSRHHVTMPGNGGANAGGMRPRGQDSIACYPCKNTIIENNIFEDQDVGITNICRGDCNDNKYMGNIAIDVGQGYVPYARCEDYFNSEFSMPHDIYIENMLIVRAQTYPSACNSCKNFRNNNMTILGSVFSAEVQTGIQLTLGPAVVPAGCAATECINGGPPDYGVCWSSGEPCCHCCGGGQAGDGIADGSFTNLLMANGAGGIYIASQSNWSLGPAILYNNTGGYDPPLSDPNYTGISTANPNLGACMVYIPDTSPAYGAGNHGGWTGSEHIGATLLYQYLNGTITTTPLWDPTTSRFSGCGAFAPDGYNTTRPGDFCDQPLGGDPQYCGSCSNVHERLNVGAAYGCALPGVVELEKSVGPFYIANPGAGGDDARDCETTRDPGTPAATLAHVLPCGLPSATFVFKNGVYTGAANRLDTFATAIASGATPTAPTTIKAENNKGATLQLTGNGQRAIDFATGSANVTIDGLVLDGAGFTSTYGVNVYLGSQNIHFINGEIKNTTRAGVYLQGCAGCTIANSNIHNNGGPGIWLGPDNPDLVVSKTLITNNAVGIDMYDDEGASTVDHVVITQSLLASNSITGARLRATGTGLASSLVANSIIHNTTGTFPGTGHGLQLFAGSDSVQVLNNTFYQNAGYGVVLDVGAGATLLSNNIFWLNGGTWSGTPASSPTNTTGDPVFAAPGPPTAFHPTTNLTINAGTTYPRIPADYDGTSRDAPYTIGAEEEVLIEAPTATLRGFPYSSTGGFLVP